MSNKTTTKKTKTTKKYNLADFNNLDQPTIEVLEQEETNQAPVAVKSTTINKEITKQIKTSNQTKDIDQLEKDILAPDSKQKYVYKMIYLNPKLWNEIEVLMKKTNKSFSKLANQLLAYGVKKVLNNKNK